MGEIAKSVLVVFTPENLRQYTNDFSEDNFLGDTHFGKLYRGTILHGSDPSAARHVTVKIWEDPPPRDPVMWQFEPGDNKLRLEDEEKFLTDPSVIRHPNLVKLIGCCYGEPLGVVYDLNPQNTLHSLIVEDIFDWPQRIRVAIGLACLLDFLHGEDGPYMVRNIDAAHILVDKDCNPSLCDFSMLRGGVLLGNRAYSADRGLSGSFGYIDEHLVSTGVGWSIKCDVYSYGCVLLSLIAKRVVDKKQPSGTYVDTWAKKQYQQKKEKLLVNGILKKVVPKCSLVHKSLEEDPLFHARDGLIITDLAMSCVEFEPAKRPTMNEVVQKLRALRAVKRHGKAYFGFRQGV